MSDLNRGLVTALIWIVALVLAIAGTDWIDAGWVRHAQGWRAILVALVPVALALGLIALVVMSELSNLPSGTGR